MHLSSFIVLLTTLLVSFTSKAAAGAVRIQAKRQATTSTVYKFPNRVNLENLAVRPNGNILLTRFDAAEIWTVDPTTKAATKLASINGANCAAGITEVQPDIFAVIAGNFSNGGNKAGSWGIWKLNMTSSPATVSLLKAFPESGMFNGLTTLNNDTILIADGAKGLIYRLSLSTAAHSVLITDTASMGPPANSPVPLGIDGIRYNNGSVYFTNIFKNTYNKVPVDVTGQKVGKVSTIVANFPGGADDLAIGPEGDGYVALQTKGVIVRVKDDGTTAQVASVAGCTSAAFARGGTGKTLYVTTNSGSVIAVNVP